MRRLPSPLILVLASTWTYAVAGPIVTDMTTLGPGNTWTYVYTVENSTTQSLFGFTMTGQGFLIQPGTTSGPNGWAIFENSDGVTWLSLDGSTDIGPGQSLTGFTFQSDNSPDALTAQLLLTDPNTGDFSQVDADTTGPTGQPLAGAPVPEPASAVLVLFSLFMLGLFQHAGHRASTDRGNAHVAR